MAHLGTPRAPYSGQVGHVPDTTWTGTPVGRQWQDQTQRVNASLGGAARGYPIGFRPTIFQIKFIDGRLYPQIIGG